MSFFIDIHDGLFFSQKTSDCLNRSKINFTNSLSLITTPYLHSTSNIRAIQHPVFHTAQLLLDAAHLVYGSLVLVGTLATGNFSASGKTTLGLFQLIGAAALEMLNITLSILSLATRQMATAFNLGYAENSLENEEEQKFPTPEEASKNPAEYNKFHRKVTQTVWREEIQDLQARALII